MFKYIAQYISVLQDNSEIYKQIQDNNKKEKELFLQRITKAKQELSKTIDGIEVMKSHLPEAMTGNYPLSVEIIADTIKQFEEKKKSQTKELELLTEQYESMQVNDKDWDELCKSIPTWVDVFNNADKQTKRVLINKLVDKIIITNEKITVKFKINLEYPQQLQPRMSEHDMVPKQTLIHGYRNIILNDLVIDFDKS